MSEQGLYKLRQKCELTVSFLNLLQSSPINESFSKQAKFMEKIRRNKRFKNGERRKKMIKDELSQIIEMDSQIEQAENQYEKDNTISVSFSESLMFRQNWAQHDIQIDRQEEKHFELTREETIEMLFSSNQDIQLSGQPYSNEPSNFDFKVIKFIDEGVNGKVYLAQHRVTGLVCSIKVIFKSSILPEFEEDLMREIKIQSHLIHPNIIQLYGFFADDHNIYLILEPCMDGNLLQFIHRKPALEADVKDKISQIASAIDFMHSQHVIHRDLKPENIVLHHNFAKICDFGCATYSPIILRGTFCGSLLYCSPEVLRNELYDSRVDVWSLGMITYELFFQKPPFDIKSLKQLVKIIQQEVYFPSERKVSSQAIQFMKKCLQKDKDKRIKIQKVVDDNFLRKLNYK